MGKYNLRIAATSTRSYRGNDARLLELARGTEQHSGIRIELRRYRSDAVKTGWPSACKTEWTRHDKPSDAVIQDVDARSGVKARIPRPSSRTSPADVSRLSSLFATFTRTTPGSDVAGGEVVPKHSRSVREPPPTEKHVSTSRSRATGQRRHLGRVAL